MNSAAVKLASSGKGSRGPRGPVTTELVSKELWPSDGRRATTHIEDIEKLQVGELAAVNNRSLFTVKKDVATLEDDHPERKQFEVRALTDGRPGVLRIQ